MADKKQGEGWSQPKRGVKTSVELPTVVGQLGAVFHRNNFKRTSAFRGRDGRFVALLFADQGAGDGGFDGDLAIGDAGFMDTDDLIAGGFGIIEVSDRDCGAKHNLVMGDLGGIDNLRIRDNVL